MQELKAKQQSPFTIDKPWLAQQRPGLLLTQDACRACDVDSSVVAQVTKPALPLLHSQTALFLLGNFRTAVMHFAIITKDVMLATGSLLVRQRRLSL